MAYIKCSSSEEEFRVLEILEEKGFRWNAREYPTEYIPSEHDTDIDFYDGYVYIVVNNRERRLIYDAESNHEHYEENSYEDYIDAQDFILAGNLNCAPPEIPPITDIEELWK